MEQTNLLITTTRSHILAYTLMVRSYLNVYGKHVVMLSHRYWGAAFGNHKLAIASNTVSSTITLAGGDMLQQLIHGDWVIGDSEKKWDWRRSMRFGMIGLIHGPMLFHLYRWMDYTLKLQGSKLSIVLKKCFLDLATAPIFSCASVAGVSFQEGNSLYESFMEWVVKYPQIFILDCCTWPTFQFINFWYLPNKYRVLYTNCVQLCYNTVMSYIKHHGDLFDIRLPKL